MAKFEIDVVTPEQRFPDGRVIPARVVLIPLDDAAKVTPQGRDAQLSGRWTPKDPDERKKAAMRLATAHAKEDVRRGIVDKDDMDERVKFLLKKIYKV